MSVSAVAGARLSEQEEEAESGEQLNRPSQSPWSLGLFESKTDAGGTVAAPEQAGGGCGGNPAWRVPPASAEEVTREGAKWEESVDVGAAGEGALADEAPPVAQGAAPVELGMKFIGTDDAASSAVHVRAVTC